MWCVIVFALSYAASVYFNWKYANIAYSKDGVYRYKYTDVKDMDADLREEMTWMFIPVINTIGLVRWLVQWPYSESVRKQKAIDVFKVFDIKE